MFRKKYYECKKACIKKKMFCVMKKKNHFLQVRLKKIERKKNGRRYLPIHVSAY